MKSNSGSRLLQMQARFQQRQIAEKEQKMVALFEAQQARALERVGATASQPLGLHKLPQGKVRAMFEERRSKAGVDRSKPLQPINNGTTVNKNRHKKSSSDVLMARDKNHNNPKFVASMTNSRPTDYNYNIEDETFPINLAPPTPLVSYTKINEHTRSNIQTKLKVDGKSTRENNPHVNIAQVVFETTKDRTAVGLKTVKMPKTISGEIEKTNSASKSDVKDAKLNSFGVKSKHSNDKNIDSRAKISHSNIKKEEANHSNINKNDFHNQSKTNETSTNANDLAVKASEVGKNNKQSSLTTKLKNVFKQNKSNSDEIKRNSSKSEGIKKSKVNTKVSKSIIGPNAMRSTKRPSQQSIQEVKTAPCPICNRHFAIDRLATHEAICRKASQKKRKPYDALKHRLQGTEAEPFIKQIRKNPPKLGAHSTHRGDWRSKHQEFISSIRNAKEVQAHIAAGGKASDLPPPPPSENPDYVECPHCNRKFNPQAAERHIPKCATYEFNKSNKQKPSKPK